MANFVYLGEKHISFSKKKKLEKMFFALKELMIKTSRESGNNAEIKKQVLENKLIEVVKEYPELIFCAEKITEEIYDGWWQTHNESFLYTAFDKKYYNLVKEITNNKEVCTMLFDDHGNSFIEFIAIMSHYECAQELLFDILDKHPTLLRHKGKNGNNLACFAAYRYKDVPYLKELIIRTINDEGACYQLNDKGNNIGMVCAKNGYQELFDLAYKNILARAQINKNGDNMAMIAQNNGLIVPPLSKQEVKEFYEEQINNKIYQICR
ncbi:MAG: hypothetical protein E7376_00730 [Clostridiales bacterium]|nr:hypothetical protein [Clostridiales bacterium]